MTLPWAKLVFGPNNKMSHVQCKVYILVFSLQKLDGLQWHTSCYMATNGLSKVKINEYYFSLNNQHAMNEK
jgi:hypothetical protein